MSSTISTSRPSIEASRSLRIRTTPEESVDEPYEATAMKSTSHVGLQVAHEVGEEEDRALQHADQQQLAALVVARDLLGQLAHAVRELVALHQDLADAGLVHPPRV